MLTASPRFAVVNFECLYAYTFAQKFVMRMALPVVLILVSSSLSYYYTQYTQYIYPPPFRSDSEYPGGTTSRRNNIILPPSDLCRWPCRLAPWIILWGHTIIV